MLGQEAPLAERGAVLGAFGLCGAIGIIIAAGVGGWLFGHWKQSGPFIMAGLANLVVVALSLAVWRRAPGPAPATTAKLATG